MANHKLSKHAQQIFDFREQGLSVRDIAKALSTDEERVAPSTVQHFISKQENGNNIELSDKSGQLKGDANAESEESVQVDQAAVLGELYSITVRLDELDKTLDRLRDFVDINFHFLGRMGQFEIHLLLCMLMVAMNYPLPAMLCMLLVASDGWQLMVPYRAQRKVKGWVLPIAEKALLLLGAIRRKKNGQSGI